MDPRVVRYLARIGWDDTPPSPSLDALTALHQAHLFTVPFENLDIRGGRPIAVDVPDYLEKIVERKRGGFCYELNAAFAWLLTQLGFRVQMWAAEVHGDAGWGIPFDHMLLNVEFEVPVIADVGFGDNFLTPLFLEHGRPQAQCADIYQLDFDGLYWCLGRRSADETAMAPQYRFRPTAHQLDDFRPGIAFHQSPASHFTQRTVCSRATPDGRVTLRSDRLIVTEGGNRRTQPVQSAEAWRSLLSTHFGVQVPDLDVSRLLGCRQRPRSRLGAHSGRRGHPSWE